MKHEDLHQFEVGGNVDEGNADISLNCTRCDWHVWLTVGTEEDSPGVDLARLQTRAQEHAATHCSSTYEPRVGDPGE